jgi:L-threonylcarbamoyladenylate synthase
MTPRPTPAVFLDRDGTIIEDRGHLRSPADVVFYPETLRALLRLQEHFRLFIVTHQPGVSSGIVSAEEVARVNEHVVDELRKNGVIVSAVYCCPHRRDEQCACIKPKPFFLHQAAEAFGVDMSRSFVVGDHPHDVVLADNAGAAGVYVLTGHGAKHRAEIPACRAVVPGIREAAEWVLACREIRAREDETPGLLTRAADILRNGGVVAFPTETVYGLGAAVFDEKAVARVFEIKQRPRFDPLIVHVSGPEQLSSLVREVPDAAKVLIERFWPGPLTLVLLKTSAVPDLVTAGLPTVAVRMPRHPVALDLIDRAGMPIAAPSANPFGYISPTTAQHVVRHLGHRVDMVLDGGPCAVGVESTVLSLAGRRPAILRAGGVAREDIESVLGSRLDLVTRSDQPASPGQLPNHYAPKTPIIIGAGDGDIPEGARVGLLSFRARPSHDGFAAVEVLSRDGNPREAAIRLFAALHRLDTLRLDMIVADAVPETGLGLAIMDRLRRASGDNNGVVCGSQGEQQVAGKRDESKGKQASGIHRDGQSV